VSGTLPPIAALAHAVRLLAAHGFATTALNERGDSFYLQRPGCPWHLRLSNHARTAKQRRRRTDILTSLVIAVPRSEVQIAAHVNEALRNFEAALRMHDTEG
jgi:hypothetical protein